MLITSPLVPLARFGLRWLVLKPYATVLRCRRRFYQLFESSDLLDLLRRHQTVLYLAVAGAIIVSLNSQKIKAATTEDFGQNNLLFPLIQQDSTGDLGSEEVSVPLPMAGRGPANLSDEDGALLQPILVTTVPGVVGRDRVEYYQVQPGDTVSSIAGRFGLQMSTVLWENKLTARSILRLGQKLTILPTDGVTYKVKRGDTVEKIARAFRVGAEDILAFNPGSALQPGQVIMIPGGQPLYEAPPTPRPQPKPTSTPTAPTTGAARTSSSRLLWPTVHRRLTQYYSWRHTGVDIADPIGTPVYAAEEGVVVTAGWNRGGYGFYTIIDHGSGLQTLYAHNSKLAVKVGDHVLKGQPIAEMGSTGRSTGSHLHFEVRVNGRRTNPLNYIR